MSHVRLACICAAACTRCDSILSHLTHTHVVAAVLLSHQLHADSLSFTAVHTGPEHQVSYSKAVSQQPLTTNLSAFIHTTKARSMAVEVTQILFKDFVNEGKVPKENFVVDKSQKLNASELKDGEIFVETLYLSVDPYMRTRMIKMEVCGAARRATVVLHSTTCSLQRNQLYVKK